MLTAICLMALSGLAYLAFEIVGGLGVGILGLFVLFIAVRIDLEGNRPVGPQMTPDLHASQYRAEARENSAARASRRSDIRALMSATRLAMMAGAMLTATGFGLVFLS